MPDKKEKAKELIDRFINVDLPCSCGNENTCDVCVCGYIDKPHAKQCALICVDEIQKALSREELIKSPYTTLNARQDYIKLKKELNKL